MAQEIKTSEVQKSQSIDYSKLTYEQLVELENNVKEQKKQQREQDKKVREEKAKKEEAHKKEVAAKELNDFTNSETEVVLNLRFTNPKLFEGSKYRTIEEKSVIAFVMDYFKKQSTK